MTLQIAFVLLLVGAVATLMVTAPRLSASCSAFLAPMITLVTAG